MMIYLDQVKCNALGWCVGVMHWTDHRSCFFLKILSNGITITPESFYDIDSKFWENYELRYQVKVTLIHLGVRPLLRSKFLVHWVITFIQGRTQATTQDKSISRSCNSLELCFVTFQLHVNSSICCKCDYLYIKYKPLKDS
jgi:hypothetical protein